MKWNEASVLGVWAAAWLSVSLEAGLPSRLRLSAPAVESGRVRLSWTVPGDGWLFEVQEASSPAGPWELAGGGGVGLARTGQDSRLADGNERMFRVVSTPPVVNRGRVLNAVKTTTYTAGQLTFLFLIQGLPLTAQYDVEVYTVVYETPDPWGLPTQGSASLAIPVSAGKRWPLLSYQHGTVLKRTDAPTGAASVEGLAGVVMATTGYAVVSADYLGLGVSPGHHPYLHAASEATATVDAVRAVKAVCGTRKTDLNGQLFLAGYSQGGHATLAALRELETQHAAELPVTACAAMAGPYDLSGVVLDDALTERSVPTRYYFPYLLQMLVDLYGLAPGLSDLLAPPYNTQLPPLLNGLVDAAAVDSLMPLVPNHILRPEVLASVRSNPGHPLRVALRDNDVTGFTPKSPLRLYHCSGDQDVLPANSVVARDRFAASGMAVPLVDPRAGATHGDCAQPALIAAKVWFDSLRQ